MMDSTVRAFVRERARGRGEYCQLHENDADFLSFHVEHIIAKQHGGAEDPQSLCFSCPECNWAKGPNLSGMLGGKLYPLFNRRRQSWNRHFRWEQTTLVGKTMSGKFTVRVLNINKESRIMLRENLLFEGRFPPEG
jgi:HNH endonuclease